MNFTEILIETNRFILRPFIPEDAKGLFELDSDPEVHKYLGKHLVSNIEESESIVKHIQKQYNENRIGRWAIIESASNEFIGWTGLKYEKNIRSFPYYDLGYRLKRKFWGQGIATETAFISLKYGFEKMNLEKICAAAHIENGASNKVLKKVGFHTEGTFEFDGAVHNWYEIRKEDWNSRSKGKMI